MEKTLNDGLRRNVSPVQQYIFYNNARQMVNKYVESGKYDRDCKEAVGRWIDNLVDIKDMPLGIRYEFIRNGE